MKLLHLLWFALLLSVSAVFAPNLHAQRSFGIGFNAGTTGAGINGVFRINDRINARVGYHAMPISQTGTYDDMEVGLDYNADIDISSLSLMVDFFPFKKFLKLTAGLYKLNWNLNASVNPNESYEVEGRFFTPERLGSLTADLSYADGFAPYLGIGFGNAVAKGLPVKLSIDLGMINTGAPTLDMQGTGMIGPTADNAANIQTGLNEFEWYPVINVGLSIAFMNVAK